MRKLAFLLAMAVIAMPEAATAKVEFAQYEGKDAIKDGQGGTKVVKDGIDFWTTGTPPRRFQILGILTDVRKDRRLSGHAIGSSEIAKKTHEVSADALILLDQDSANAGIVGSLNSFNSGSFGSAFLAGREVHRITSRFLVVKYVIDKNG